MLRGQFTHSLDAKGRVSLPARFREALVSDSEGRVVLVPAPFEPCLQLHSLRAWERIEDKIAQLPSFDAHATRLRRIYLSAATECELDKAGRILVPPHLRERAGLTRDVLWAGMGQLAELWSMENWDKTLSLSPEDEAAFKRAVMEQLRI
jgi:MraZ protein